MRVYRVPPRWLLDEALIHGLRVLVDVPWEKHRCFFEDWTAPRDAIERVRRAAEMLGDHPGLFALSVANEFPSDVVRFYGRRRVGRFVDDLIDAAKEVAPSCLATFANHPSTELLTAERPDFACFNVYLDNADELAAYIDRLQHRAGPRPLLLGEHGTDSLRHGEAPFDEGLARADDWDLWLRLALAGCRYEYADLPSTLSLVRSHPTSLTKRNRQLIESSIRRHARVPLLTEDPELLRVNAEVLDWLRRVHGVATLIDEHVGEAPFVLIDQDEFRSELIGYPIIPFVEHAGHYRGPPSDDAHAITELERLRRRTPTAALAVVIASPASWWLDFYSDFRGHLHSSAMSHVAAPAATIFVLEPIS